MRTCKLGGKNPVGYCAYHKCCVTKKQMESRQCIKKGCKAFKKNAKHPLWVQKEKSKQFRREKKLRTKMDFVGISLERSSDGGYIVRAGNEALHFDSLDAAAAWFRSSQTNEEAESDGS